MIEKSEGYKSLRAAIEGDCRSGWPDSDRMAKLTFACDRAKHYEEKTGVPAGDILTAWEGRRNYWYMNYYQDANQPLITGDSVRVFETKEDARAAIGKGGFRCPRCKGVSANPYECNSGVKLILRDGNKPEKCNWKVYGLFGALGKGVTVFVKSELRGWEIFMPVAWEKTDELIEA